MRQRADNNPHYIGSGNANRETNNDKQQTGGFLMAVILEQEQIVIIPTGDYRARVDWVEEVEGQFGPQLRFEFELVDEPWEGKALMGWASAKINRRTKLYKWTRAILGRTIRESEPFNSDKLVGKECRLSILVELRDDGSEFNKIASVLEAKSEPASNGREKGEESTAESTGPNCDDIDPAELERELFGDPNA